MLVHSLLKITMREYFSLFLLAYAIIIKLSFIVKYSSKIKTVHLFIVVCFGSGSFHPLAVSSNHTFL